MWVLLFFCYNYIMSHKKAQNNNKNEIIKGKEENESFKKSEGVNNHDESPDRETEGDEKRNESEKES